MGTRRLAAIVAVDVVGFSSMMAADEDATLASLKAHRTATDPIVLNHGGRVVKNTGDGMLLEVPSAVEAVRAAIDVQQMMVRRNGELSPERRMQYRIGINLGDVIVDDDEDVYGDGVNVAARLEALADPGGICISEAVHRHVAEQLDEVEFADWGEHRLKNIPVPVRVWAVEATDDGADVPLARPFSPSMALAVLPFVNLSADAEQEYFVDGITEDLITALSQDPYLQVIARNSVFAFKGRPVDVRTVGRRLDARYVVEGSVRRSAGRVRVSAQLVESESGLHLWADRYDRDLGDVFALQDEIVDEVRQRVAPTVRSAEERRVAVGRPERLDAWDLLQRGRWHANQHTRLSLQAAIELCERSVAMSPSVLGHADLNTHWLEVAMQRWRVAERNAFDAIVEHGEAAHHLDPQASRSNEAMAVARTVLGRTREAVGYARRAVELNPHVPGGWTTLGHALYFEGQHAEAVQTATEGWRLGPHEPWRWHTATVLAFAHYLHRNYDAALRWADEVFKLNDYLQAHVVAAAALGQQGRTAAASEHLAHLLADRPALTAADYRRSFRWRHDADIDHFLDGLVAAGLSP